MADKTSFKVVGTSKKVGNYLVWEVHSKDGALMAACYGPASASAAATYARELNKDTECSPLEAIL